MKRSLLSVCLGIILGFVVQSTHTNAQDSNKNPYKYHLNLTTVVDDLLTIELYPPTFSKDTVSFFFPKVVPGTYSIYDFGRFVQDFKVFDKEGKEIAITHPNDNQWIIPSAKSIGKIIYKVEDTYDSKKSNVVFEPAGTNFEAGKNFVLNTHGIFGYFEDMKMHPFEIEITKPETFYGSTSLVPVKAEKTKDLYSVEDYHRLVDAPMMYNEPDTLVLKVGGADILISVYSPNRDVTAKSIESDISKILTAQKTYLGGTLPIKKYAFIIYLFSNYSRSGSYGALEHSYSSFYYLQEVAAEYLSSTITDIAAHEFFHIITPLSIHSEQIHYFDFNAPKMSKHLWLYEGVTEYFSLHVQVNQNLMDIESFLNEMRSKMMSADGMYNTSVSFTDLSSQCLGKYKNQYGNVYQKGALIGMCLDLQLNILSDGKYSLMQLMKDLSKKYGENNPFEDEKLFDVITEMTYPEIREFFRLYVEDSKVLPFEELLPKLGIFYHRKYNETETTIGNVIFDKKEGGVYIKSTWGMDNFGRDLGYQKGDKILKINGKEITDANFDNYVHELRKASKPGQSLEIIVEREIKGKMKAKKLKGKFPSSSFIKNYFFEIENDITEEQRKLRDAYFYWKR